ncbi:uncharacterized protein LOC142564505 [Dermacentor variabilis]|uniref:uncharacterized protein LOC142564505 n=1 Tax=Dermacentor variabilis TaxID=34621 RepID=UPI003F5B8D7E
MPFFDEPPLTPTHARVELYLWPNVCQGCLRGAYNSIIRKVFKLALSLPVSTHTEYLLKLEVHNTLEEIIEAEERSQLLRLSDTAAGHKVSQGGLPCLWTKATYAPFVKIESVDVKSATLGLTLRADLKLRVDPTFGFSPALEFSVGSERVANTSSATPLPCAYSVVPRKLRFCGGGTDREKLFSAEWNNTCPIKAGTYTARLSFDLPDGLAARSCVDDGKLETTLRIKDEGYILDCVSFPVTIGLN